MQSPALQSSTVGQPTRISMGRAILAVSAGTLIDLGGTNLAAFAITIVVVFRKAFELASEGLSQAQMQAQLMGETASIKSFPITIAFGILFSLLGGYVAGRIARRDEVLYGMASGLGVIALSLACTFALRLPTGSQPFWQVLLFGLLNVGVNTFGGFLARLQRVRTRGPKLPEVAA